MKNTPAFACKRTALTTAVSVAIASFSPMVMAASFVVTGAESAPQVLSGVQTGVINSAGVLQPGVGAVAVAVDSAATGVVITNSGAIHTNGAAAISVDAAALNTAVTNQAGALMNANGAAAIYFAGGLGGSVTNHGQIVAAGQLAAAVQVMGGLADADVASSGTITVSAAAQSNSALANGMVVGNLSLASGVTNSGTLTVTSATQMGSGAFEAYAYGLHTGSVAGGSAVSNAGAISVLARNTNHNASATGVLTGALIDINSSVINSGTVVAKAFSSSAFAGAAGLKTGALAANTKVESSGNMTVQANGFESAQAQGIATGNLASSAGVLNASLLDVQAFATQGTANAAGVRAGALSTSSSVSNTGTIKITADSMYKAIAQGVAAQDLISGGATVSSAGSITSTAHVSGLNSSGSAMAAGITAGLMSGVSSSLLNSGHITTTATQDRYGSAQASGVVAGDLSGAGAMLINSSAVDATATAKFDRATAVGVNAGSLIGELSNLSNSSTITAKAQSQFDEANAYGIRAGSVSGATTKITNSGTLNVSATGGSTANAFAHGLLTGGLLGASSIVTNSGKINVAATLNYQGEGMVYGMEVRGDLGTGTQVLNSGAVVVDVGHGANAVSAYGTAHGLYVSGNLAANAHVTNSGSITAKINGVGSSNANAYGAYLNGSMASGASLQNTGSITATALGDDWVYGYGTFLRVSSSLDNSGSIIGSADARHGYAYAYGVQHVAGTSFPLINSGSIAAVVTTHSTNKFGVATGLYVGGGVDTLTNSGSITAVANSPDGNASATGVDVFSLGGTLTNSGTISGTVASNPDRAMSLNIHGGSGSVINSGKLSGRLNLGQTVSLTNSGVVSLQTGASVIGGSYTQTATGLLETTAVSSSQFGRVTITGNANFAATPQLSVRVAAVNTLANGDVLADVVKTNAALSTTLPTTVSDNSLAFNFTASTGPQSISLTTHATGITTLKAATAGTVNESAAKVLDALFLSNPDAPELKSLYSAGSKTAVAAAVGQLTPVAQLNAPRATLTVQDDANRVVDVRQDTMRGESGGDFFMGDRNIWLKPFGSQATMRGAAGYDASTVGMAMGIDGEVSAVNRFGFAYAYTSTKLTPTASQSDTLKGHHLAVYGSHNFDARTYLDYQAGIGMNSSNADSSTKHLSLAIGRSYPFASSSVFTPSLRAAYATISTDANSTGPVTAQARTVDALNLGADGKFSMVVGDDSRLAFNAGITYDALAEQDSLTASFASAPNAAFITKGSNPSAVTLHGGVGYTLTTAKSVQITARYDLDARSNYTNQTLSLKAALPF